MHINPQIFRIKIVSRRRRDTGGRSVQGPAPIGLLLVFLFLLIAGPTSQAKELASAIFLTFFDVGQGDALLIHQPGECSALIDTGPPGSGQKIGAFLTEKGISRLDRLIISHPHQDHFGGVLSLPADLAIGEVNDNGVINNREMYFHPYQNWRTNYLYHPLKKDDIWRCGDVVCTVLGPDRAKGKTPIINDTSLILMIDIGPIKLLLPGDLEDTDRQELNARAEEFNVDIFKVPHHGAKVRHLGDWLKSISPELSVVSVGKNNLIGAPDRHTLEVIRQHSGRIWRTDLQGDLEIRIDGQGWHYVKP